MFVSLETHDNTDIEREIIGILIKTITCIFQSLIAGETLKDYLYQIGYIKTIYMIHCVSHKRLKVSP